eukprot:200726-Pyramimonas_sp.AAC.1
MDAWCLSSIIQVLASVVDDACRECRAWASDVAPIAPSVEVVAAPDQEVELGSFLSPISNVAHDRQSRPMACSKAARG